MLLYANGCSMTLGDEMSDPRRTCFPTLVAEHFGFDLHNDAHSVASNCRILRTTLLWLADYLGKGGDPADLFVMIGWTAPGRREFGLSEEEGSIDSNYFWRNIFVHCQLEGASPDLLKLHKLVFGSFACARESMSRLLVAATSLQGVLASHGIRYCFHHTMPVLAVHAEAEPLASALDTRRFHRFLGNKSDFLSSCISLWNLPIGPKSHPLEEGHRRWAAELIDFIEKGRLL